MHFANRCDVNSARCISRSGAPSNCTDPAFYVAAAREIEKPQHLIPYAQMLKFTAIVMALEVEVKLEVETGAGRGSESAATDVARLMMAAVKMQPALPG